MLSLQAVNEPGAPHREVPGPAESLEHGPDGGAHRDHLDDRVSNRDCGESTQPSACDHARIPRFILTIEGPGWTDADDIELPRLPDPGETLETKFGTMIVVNAEDAPELASYAGKIVCRFP